jgi:phage recombination protein Bet
MPKPKTKAIAKKKQSAAVSKSPWTQDQINLICKTVAKGATPDEVKVFLYISNKVGLDPLAKQIYLVKRGGVMTPQTGIDGYRAIAERTQQLAGISDVEYDSEDKKNPNKATVTVYRMVNGNRIGFTASARWTEYKPGEKLDFMWRKMPYLMLGKCAESLALRKAFPNDLNGIYTEDEMAQADTPATTLESGVDNSKTEKPEKVVNKKDKAVEVEVMKGSDFSCSGCGNEITKETSDYSKQFFNKELCKECQSFEK